MAATRMREADDDRLIDLIYDAAFDDALWQPVLEQLSDRVGAHACNLTQIDVLEGHGFGIGARVPEGTVADFFSQWAQRNVIGLVDDAETYAAGWNARITRDDECIDRRLLERSAYWNEFLVPIEAHHVITVRLALRGNDLTSLGFGRPARKGAYEDDEIARLAAFQPHLIRAERIWREIGVRQAEVAAMDAVLAGSAEALFFLGDDGRLLRRTAAAEALLRGGGALRLAGGRLRAAQEAEDAALRRALAEALAGGTPGSVRATGAAPGEALTLSVTRLGERAAAGVTRGRCLLVTARPAAAAGLRGRYGLTAAEEEVARALSDGVSLRTLAARRGVSVNTVRNQLGAVFDKTGVRRQQDLVRLLAVEGHAVPRGGGRPG